jgi:hypothetical protein
MGGPERGIAWFAESDRDWSLDRDQPCLLIRREAQTTSLVIRMVTQPLELTRTRRIVFGMMATPAGSRRFACLPFDNLLAFRDAALKYGSLC